MTFPLIDRKALKREMKRLRYTYADLALSLNLSKTGLFFKIKGRNGRGVLPFTEEEVQSLRAIFGDSIFYPAPEARKQ